VKKRIAFFRAVIVVSALVLNSLQIVHAIPLLQGSADLTLLDIVSDPPNPAPWDSLHYISHVENQGTEGAEVWVWYYVDGIRVTGENENWGHLDPDSTREVDFGHPGLSEGWHTIKFVVDPEDAVAEGNETNNEIEDTFCIGTCEPQYPDVVVEQIDWTPGSPLVGDIMHFTVHVQNEGTANTSPWTQVGVRLFIDGISVGDDYVSNIAPGTTEFFDFYWIATSGCHTVRAVADCGDYIPESDEDNNEREESLCASTPSESDLIVPQIDWTPGSPLMGDIMHFTVHVENQGGADTSPWGQVGVRLFIDGISVGDDYASNIAPGTTEFFDFYWTATSGGHTVRAVADYGDYVPESDEGNNEREESFDVTCPAPPAPSLSSPSNGSSTCDTTPYLDWSSVSEATSYSIQVDDNSSFSSPVESMASNSDYTLGSPLSPGTYYWRVRASNSCGDSSWSSVWSVTILATPGAPSQVSPSNGSTTDDGTPTLDWGSVSGATSYRVQVDDNSGFTSPEIDHATSNTSYTPSGALADGTYYWRVQASNSCGSGSWSGVWSFTIETSCPTPSPPSLYSPSNGSSTCDTTPYLNWSSVSEATSYRIQVDDNSSFTASAIDTTTSNSNYTPGTALAPGTYYWRARASNACGDSSWSSVWSVTVLSTPGAPSLVSPSNGSTTDDSTPTLDWGSVSGATSYRVQVDDNSGFTSPEIDQTTSNTSYTPSSALADDTYYWRVQASNSCGSGSWSAVWSFTIEISCPAPPAPSLSSPSNGSSTCDTTPYLDWSSVSEATFYRIQVDDSSSFSSPAINITTSNSNYTPGTALSPGTYYWRVRASNACGHSSWSSVWSVTVLSTPGVPSLVSPSNGSTTDDSTPTLDWGSVSGATSYRVQVDDNSGFTSPEIDQTTSNTSYTPSSVLADGTYYWRVQASNSCGSGSWSAAWQFIVDTSISAPSNLDAAAVSQMQIDLTWQDTSPDESDFHIERSPNGSTGWTEIDTVGANVTDYTDTGLSCGTTYYYRVRAHRHSDGQYSGYSNVDSATTQACSEPKPDLVVNRIVGRPDGDGAWDSWQFDAYVQNVGEVAYEGGTTYRGFVDGVLCEEWSLPDLAPEEEKRVDFGWGGGVLGEHTVCVVVDPSNSIDEENEENNELCQPFTVGEPHPGRPQAVLQVSPTRVRVGTESIRFDGKSSHDPDGTVAKYLYDFDDGTTSTWIEQSACYHTYDQVGEYHVRLRVQDNLGITSDWSASQTVVVKELPSDERAPDIRHIDFHPGSIYVHGCSGIITATVTCRVEDSSGIAYVSLRYTLDQEPYKVLSMTQVASNVYQASIGEFEHAGVLNYHVEVADVHGNYGQTDTYSALVAECPQGPADLDLVDISWVPEHLTALEDFSLYVTLHNDGPGDFDPTDGSYTVQLEVTDGLPSLPVPLILSFSTENHGGRMIPGALETIPAGESYVVVLSGIRLPNPVSNGTLAVRLCTAEAETNPENNFLKVPFSVSEPANPADCLMMVARVSISYLGVSVGKSLDLLEDLWRCQSDPDCAAAVMVKFFGESLLAADMPPLEVAQFFDSLLEYADQFDGCVRWLGDIIAQVTADLSLAGCRGNVVIVHSPAYSLVRNQTGQLAGFLDTGERLDQIPGSQVAQVGASRFVLVPGNDIEVIRFRGLDYGTATIQVSIAQPDGSVVMLSYYELALTPETVATLDTQREGWILDVDTDGDGFVDEVRSPDELVTRRPYRIYFPLTLR